MENEIIIKQNTNDNTVTFQAKGEADFLEHITQVVISRFNNGQSESGQSFVKSYDTQRGYVGETVEIDNVNSSVPEHYITGIKTSKNGNKKYKCRYICTHCNAKENKYIEKYTEYILCRVCNQRMYVDWVEDNHNVEYDDFNNFAYAGKFLPRFNK